MEDVDEVEVKKENGLLSPEDAERTGQLAEGVRKIKVCYALGHRVRNADQCPAQTPALGRALER